MGIGDFSAACDQHTGTERDESSRKGKRIIFPPGGQREWRFRPTAQNAPLSGLALQRTLPQFSSRFVNPVASHR